MVFLDIRGGIGGGGGEFDNKELEFVDKWWIFIEFNMSDDVIRTFWAKICPWSRLFRSGWNVIIRFGFFV